MIYQVYDMSFEERQLSYRPPIAILASAVQDNFSRTLLAVPTMLHPRCCGGIMGPRPMCGAPESSSTSCSVVCRHSGQVRSPQACIQLFSNEAAGLELLAQSVTA